MGSNCKQKTIVYNPTHMVFLIWDIAMDTTINILINPLMVTLDQMVLTLLQIDLTKVMQEPLVAQFLMYKSLMSVEPEQAMKPDQKT